MAGLVPAIHVFLAFCLKNKTWMPATSAGMTWRKTMLTSGNLLAEIPKELSAEQFTALLSTPNIKIERIVSQGQTSPEGFWYDQDRNEWVMVVAGAAAILIDGEAETRTLKAGDHLNIPARTRHRVTWTDTSQPTIWLAVHYS